MQKNRQTGRKIVYDGAKSHFSQICEHPYKQCNNIHMFPKLSEVSSIYFIQTLFKIRFLMEENIFWGGGDGGWGQKLNNYTSDSFRVSKR